MASATPPPVSVVVASHGRPAWLARCLTSLGQQDYRNFEIVVVADTASLDAVRGHDLASEIKTVAVDDCNIALSRNQGIRAAGGDWIAFLDDDAAAEPTWLGQHVRAAIGLGVVATVGFVHGRNGISYQTTVTSVDAEGETHVERPGDGGAFVPNLKPGRALKLVGTNCMIRRERLLAMGGFDPAYRFYLDDSDLSLRLAAEGYRAGVAPLAQVHHAFAPSRRRTRLRAPLDLTEIGRSVAIFAHRYRGAPPDELKDRLFQRERARLIRHMVRGTCEPRDVGVRLRTLEAGWREGAVLDPAPPAPFEARATFRRVYSARREHRVFPARLLHRRAAIRAASEWVKAGGRASVFSFSLTPVRHHVWFSAPGVWVQTGGQFGRSIRSGPWFRWYTFADRLKREMTRVALVRGIGDSEASPDASANDVREAAALRRSRGQC